MEQDNNTNNRLRILAVDDEDSILNAYRKILDPQESKTESESEFEAMRAKLFATEGETPADTSAEEPVLTFELQFAHQAEQAVEMVAKSASEGDPFALVLLDMRMPPGRDGAWAAREIRDIDPHVDIVVVTAFSDVDPRELTKTVPPSDKIFYVQKPFHPHEIAQFATALGTRWKAEQQLDDTEKRTARLGRLVDSSSNEIFVFELNTKRCILANETARKNLGYSDTELLDLTIFDFNKELGEERLQAALVPLLEDEQRHSQFRSVHIRKDHSTYPVEVDLHVERDETAPVVVTIVKDITDQEESEKRIHELAYFDPVTGLPNRQSFMEKLSRAVSYSKRKNTRFAALFIDLDKFKRINDNLGHSFGDLVLRRIGERIISTVRTYDLISRNTVPDLETTVARLGGDEFTVLIPSINEPQEAAAVADRIVAEVSKTDEINGHEIVVTPSVGISMFPTDGDSVEELLKNADTAMYHAKSTQGAKFEFFSQTLSRRAQERFSLEISLRLCVSENQLELHYQPQIDLRTNKVVGVEALLRWNRPHVGLVYPNEFIPFAEDAGLINEMGEWVFDEAARKLKTWLDAGLDVNMSVNVSAVQFRYSHLRDAIQAVVDRHRIPPEKFEIELTETAVMQNADASAATLEYLKATGVSIAIDDFGIGYSSLSYLQKFPIDVLKIDRSFVSNLETNADGRNIVKAIVAMAHNLGLSVVAEGAETAGQLDILKSFDVDRVQGFYFSKPMPETETDAYLAQALRGESARRFG